MSDLLAYARGVSANAVLRKVGVASPPSRPLQVLKPSSNA